mgnify:CR=1 FL=1
MGSLGTLGKFGGNLGEVQGTFRDVEGAFSTVAGGARGAQPSPAIWIALAAKIQKCIKE